MTGASGQSIQLFTSAVVYTIQALLTLISILGSVFVPVYAITPGYRREAEGGY